MTCQRRRLDAARWTALFVLLGVGCGGGSADSDTDSAGPSSITLTTQGTESDTDDTATGSGTTTDGDDSSDSGSACPAVQVCGEACCEATEVCDEDLQQCVLDCGADAPCNDVCCDSAGGEICYVGQCIVPGDVCSAAACATQVASDCAKGEVCDPQLGQCVPDFSDPTCAFEPEVGVFDPVPRFTWGVRQDRTCDLGCQVEETCNMGTNLCEPTWNHVAPVVEPNSYQVVMSPMVADLDLDCIPEIIFHTYAGSAYANGSGLLRAIRGDDGTEVFTVTDPDYNVDPSASPAIGDIDMDGMPEIVAPSGTGQMLAFEHDGTPIWTSQNHDNGQDAGAVSLANFDGMGAPEIAYGHTIWANDGTRLFQGVGEDGTNGGFGPLSCVADLTGDGRPELISGAKAWTFTGTVGVDFAGTELWEATSPSGFCGIADFDIDGMPEVATVNSNTITIWNGQTGAELASIAIPGGGAGGPPNIADFDGDGLPELGTAGGDRYVVVEYFGPGTMDILWEADTRDGSSQRTGSSVFDFDGDGASEVVYGDEWYLRIYPGTEPDCPAGPGCDGVMTDEEILFIDINSSRTRTEYPIVADVDGDFKAEIVVSTNNESGQGAIGDAGIEVFEDRLDNWVGTRPIWNQHTYHVTNVEIDGTVPANEDPNWTTPAGNPYNSYRRNGQGELEALCAPDLVAADLVLDEISCIEDAVALSVKVINQGCLGVGPGVNVSVYQDGTLLSTVQTMVAIPAGGTLTLEIPVMPNGNPPYAFTVVVDDDGTGVGAFNECLEDNNESDPVEGCGVIG